MLYPVEPRGRNGSERGSQELAEILTCRFSIFYSTPTHLLGGGCSIQLSHGAKRCVPRAWRAYAFVLMPGLAKLIAFPDIADATVSHFRLSSIR